MENKDYLPRIIDKKLEDNLEAFGVVNLVGAKWTGKSCTAAVHAESFGGGLYHYQDYNNREIDAVITLPGGEWCAFEIKLGTNMIDEAAAALLKIQGEIENREKKAKILCVISGMSNAAYVRPDGVFVVPLTALRP